ncbi:MAG: SusC/RagA family TonB-linked outer membrane protein [Acinetobacter sp.]|nr:MAG: SusC/RagA family TonB-linked outer membrane protein [Acinetobacter sp.]
MAQQVTVTGKITSSEDGLPIPGASVKIKGTAIAVQTSTTGTYSIKTKAGDVLQFIYLGLITQEKTVGSSTVIDVTLLSDTNKLNEVVVTAFGIERSNRAVGYGAQSLKGQELANTQRDNFINALQGRIAGATITPTNGTPGASSQIIIRGGVSLDGDNQPLFVVDGLPISNNTFNETNLVGQGTFNRNNDYGNRAMDINPEEIETITILKGPEAAALYGTDGASGAVVITTKKAKAGTARVTYNNNFRFSEAYRFPEVQKVYGPGVSGGFFDDDVRTYFGSKYPAGTTFYDNLDNFYKTGFAQKHTISIEGGTDALSLRTGITYNKDDGIIPGTGYESFNAKISGVSKISSKITATGWLQWTRSRTDKAYKGNGSLFISALSWPIADDMRNYLTENGDRRTITGSYTAELDNPYFAMAKNPNNEKVNRLLANFSLDYKPLSWLTFTARGGADIGTTDVLTAYHPQSYGFDATNVSGGGTLNIANQTQTLFSGTFLASVKKKYGKFTPILNVGAEIKDDRSVSTANKGTGFLESNYYSLNNVTTTTIQAFAANALKRKLGAFATLELGYDNFLFLTLAGRQDYSSTLPTANNSFFYPTSSLSFVFSDLAPFKDLKWLSSGKLRASYGQSGKDARVPYVTKTKLIAQQTTGGGFATDVTAGNPNLEAEFTTSKEFGMEASFLKNRLSFDFSYFETVSDKQITAPRLSYATGAILGYINSGKIRNRGFELIVRGTPIKNKDFSWDVSGNISRTRGKILSLPAGQDVFYLSDTWLFDNVRAQYVVGGSISAFAGYHNQLNNKGQLLISPTTGLPIKEATFTPIGDRAPDFGIGITNTFSYKNFGLTFLLDIRKGGDIYNATDNYLYARGLSVRSLDREIPRIITGVFRDGLENTANPTPNNIVVVPYITSTYYSTAYDPQDFLEKDINWLRVKDVTLDYRLPKEWLARTKVFKTASVFFTGTDLLLITNYKGVDPSVNGLTAASGGLGGSGIDYGSFGLPRTYSFGLRVGF